MISSRSRHAAAAAAAAAAKCIIATSAVLYGSVTMELSLSALHEPLQRASHWNHVLFHNATDPRVTTWPLLGSPFPLLALTAAWLWFVLRSGPAMMRNRKPYELTALIHVINVVQILANAFVTYEFLSAGWLNGYQLQCQPCHVSDSRDAMRMARASYCFFLLKILDMADTVIYVLRRKDNQVTFLHLYHHVATLTIGWTVAKYAPGGHATLSEVMNTLVHVVMYTYYLLASLGPRLQPYLWWKKYLTQFQLTQFVLQFAHNANALRIECEYPHFIIYMFLPMIAMIFGLFVNFYVKNYKSKREKSKKQ